MNANSNTQPNRRRSLSLIGLAALGALAALSAAAWGQETPASAIPAGANFTSWADNGQGGPIVLQLFSGEGPAAGTAVNGIVKSDTNCTPDAERVSHCHNRIALADGGAIEVVHNHAMGRYPCLSPGERLSLSRLEGDWLVATAVK